MLSGLRRNPVRNASDSAFFFYLIEGAVFSWLKSGQIGRRKKVKLSRKHLEVRARRFLTNYLAAEEMRKRQFYRAVEAASQK